MAKTEIIYKSKKQNTVATTKSYSKTKDLEGFPKSKATAETAKITLALAPSSIKKVNTIGSKQTILRVNMGKTMFEASLNSKNYRKALRKIDEFGVDNCNVVLQASMTAESWKLDRADLLVQLKNQKE